MHDAGARARLAFLARVLSRPNERDTGWFWLVTQDADSVTLMVASSASRDAAASAAPVARGQARVAPPGRSGT